MSKLYRDMSDLELASVAEDWTSPNPATGRLLFALAARLRQRENERLLPDNSPRQRCRTVEEVRAARGLSREATAYIRERDLKEAEHPTRFTPSWVIGTPPPQRPPSFHQLAKDLKSVRFTSGGFTGEPGGPA